MIRLGLNLLLFRFVPNIFTFTSKYRGAQICVKINMDLVRCTKLFETIYSGIWREKDRDR